MGMKQFLSKAAPVALAGLACTGVVGTGIAAAIGRGKADILLKKAREKKGEDLTTKEKVVAVVPAYGAAAAAGTATILCIVGSTMMNAKSQATLTSAYALLDNWRKQYKKAVAERYGEDTANELEAKIVGASSNWHQQAVDYPDQKVVWEEPVSKQRIVAYEREMIHAEMHFNRNFVIGGPSSYNDWLEMAGFKKLDDYDDKGWTAAEGYYWVDFDHRFIGRDEKGRPVYAVEPYFEPIENYLDL